MEGTNFILNSLDSKCAIRAMFQLGIFKREAPVAGSMTALANGRQVGGERRDEG
jgi:hypothetical protein